MLAIIPIPKPSLTYVLMTSVSVAVNTIFGANPADTKASSKRDRPVNPKTYVTKDSAATSASVICLTFSKGCPFGTITDRFHE